MIYALIALIGLLAYREHLIFKERELWATERQTLLQRIQAPEQAVVTHAQTTMGPDRPAVDLTDDEDYWDARKQMDMVEAQMSQIGLR